MADIDLRLRLIFQKVRKRMGGQLISKMFNAKEKGKQIFGIDIPFLVDGTPAKQIDGKSSICLVRLGEYDFRKDIVRIYEKHIIQFSKRFGIDLNPLILFGICHELGHAKESRLCEKATVFPHTIELPYFPIPFLIDTIAYDLRRVQFSGINFPNIFLNGISDFAVNKELLKYGIYNPLPAKTIIMDTSESTRSNLKQEQRHKILIEKSCLLPFYVDVCFHSNIDKKMKEIIETSYRQLLGNNWDYTVDKMKQLEITTPRENLAITESLLKKIFKVNAFSMNLPQSLIFDSTKIPKFWSKNKYSVLFVG